MRVFFLAALLALAAVTLTACGEEKGTPAAATVTVTESQDPTAAVPDEPVAEEDDSEARVTVAKSGFSYDSEYGGLGYGIVLRNASSADAVNVQISVNVVDAKGLILTTDDNQIAGIPAKTTFYFGSQTFAEGGRPKSLEIDVTNDSEPAQGAGLPKVSNTAISDQGYGLVSARGQVQNPYTQPLSDFARIGIVALDSSGKVVTGGFTFLDSPLRPGRSAAFDTSLTGVSSGGGIAKVEASMENSVRP